MHKLFRILSIGALVAALLLATAVPVAADPGSTGEVHELDLHKDSPLEFDKALSEGQTFVLDGIPSGVDVSLQASSEEGYFELDTSPARLSTDGKRYGFAVAHVTDGQVYTLNRVDAQVTLTFEANGEALGVSITIETPDPAPPTPQSAAQFQSFTFTVTVDKDSPWESPMKLSQGDKIGVVPSGTALSGTVNLIAAGVSPLTINDGTSDMGALPGKSGGYELDLVVDPGKDYTLVAAGGPVSFRLEADQLNEDLTVIVSLAEPGTLPPVSADTSAAMQQEEYAQPPKTAAAEAHPTRGSSPLPIVIGLGAISLLGAGLWRHRR